MKVTLELPKLNLFSNMYLRCDFKFVPGYRVYYYLNANISQAEKDFVESTKARRAIQDTLLKLQDELKQIRHKLGELINGLRSEKVIY